MAVVLLVETLIHHDWNVFPPLIPRLATQGSWGCIFCWDDGIVNIWNLRKCSAVGLDIIANVFGDEILPTLIPLVQAKLSTSDVTWKEREAAVLALGAVDEGCIRGLYPHLAEGRFKGPT